MPAKYHQRTHSVEAIQFTDYRAATEILAWAASDAHSQCVTEDKRDGTVNRITFTLVGPFHDDAYGSRTVDLRRGEWVLRRGDGTWATMTDERFSGVYEMS